MDDLKVLWTLALVVYSFVAGSMVLGKVTWGRSRYAGMTRTPFELCSVALVISVGMGWLARLELVADA